MQLLTDYIAQALSQGITQLFFTAGMPISYKDSHGNLQALEVGRMTPKNLETLIFEQALSRDADKETLRASGEVEADLSHTGRMRARINAYWQRNTLAMTLTIVSDDGMVPLEKYPCYNQIKPYITKPSGGLFIITGAHGSPKENLAAAIVDSYNQQYPCHITTFEDTIHTLHKHQKAIVNQRNLPAKGAAECLLRSVNSGVDVCLVSSLQTEALFFELVTLASLGVLVIAVFHKGSLETLGRSVLANVWEHDRDELVNLTGSILRFAYQCKDHRVADSIEALGWQPL